MKRAHTKTQNRKWSELLTTVFTLCALDANLEQSELDRLIANSRRLANKKVTSLRPRRRRLVDLDALGHVVYQWQRSPRYLDDNGKPALIAARGPSPSIEALFRGIDRSDYFEAGFVHLKQLKRVRRMSDGRYAACSEVSIVPTFTPEVAEMLAQIVNRLLTTVLHNTSLKRKTAIRLIERLTSVPDLPQRQIMSFKMFAREQGGALINTMNDWLEGHRGKGKPRRKNAAGRVTAGLHVFGFIEKNSR